ncbi:MAG TPA: hypothetical protein VGP72_00575 [Planctomycetota bacterium]|jgi:hypothetical protein
MNKQEILQHLQQPYRESVLLDGLDDALLGYVENGNEQPRALYDLEKCVAILRVRLGWSFPCASDILRDALSRGWWPAAGMPAFAVLADDLERPSTVMTVNIPAGSPE